jgi:SPP1 gp7 family putative phage head morphogenesis protein
MAQARIPVRTPRLFKVGRQSQRVGRSVPVGRGTAILSAAPSLIPDTSKLSHVARRRIASPPMAKIEVAVEAVGSAVQSWGDRFVDAVMSRTIPDLIERADSINDISLRQDASIEGVLESLSAGPEVARRALEEAFRAVDKASSDDLRVVGVQTSTVVRNAEQLQADWVRRNTNLIKAQRDIVERVRKVVDESVRQGRSVDDIRKLLQEQVGYARSRAELTARDQTLKVYGQIQQERQQAAGFTHYVWTTSLDERVRERHAELDGKVFAWDDPPVVDERTGRREHPGGDYQCRCSAVPYTGDDIGETPETAPDVPAFTFEPPSAPAPIAPTPTPIAPTPIAPAVSPAIEPLTSEQFLERAQVAPRATAKREQAVRAAESAIRGRSLEDLAAIPFTSQELAGGDKSLEFLRTNAHFLTTGNVADNFGSSKGGLPQITIGADGTAYLSNGRHRLTVARERGLRQIIARVVHVGPRGGVRWEYVGPVRV